MMRAVRLLMVMLLATFGATLSPAPANAQYVTMGYAPLQCIPTLSTTGSVSTFILAPAPGTAFYDPNPVCRNADQNSDPLEHIFSDIICYFVTILNEVSGKVYCGMQGAIQPVLAAMLTLYVLIFAVQILMGVTRLSPKEMMVRFLKIVLVWTFATNATYGITIVFTFFMTLAIEGTSWVVSMITQTQNSDAGTVFLGIDNLIRQAILGPAGVTSASTNVKLIGFFGVMSYIVPTVFILAVYWLWNTICMMAQALVGYMLAIAAIAFLVAMGPIFISLALFQITHHFFELWLKYLTSYALQIIIVFAIITMWVATMQLFGGFFENLANMIFPYQEIYTQSPAVADVSSTWGICKPGAPYIANSMVNGIQISWLAMECSPNFSLLAPGHIPEEANFIYYIIYNLLTLLIISYAYFHLMQQAHTIAQQLAGPQYIPMWEQGFGFHSGIKGGEAGGSELFHKRGGGVSGGSSAQYRANAGAMASRR